MTRCLILGAGGHAKVVADTLLRQGVDVVGFLDDDPASRNKKPLGLPVLGSIDSFTDHLPSHIALGIGSNQARKAITDRFGADLRTHLINVIHPSAIVSMSVRLGQGVLIAAGAVINPDAHLGDHVIVNTGATVDHDCRIASFAHVAPGATLAGGVHVGYGALIGVGASVLPNCSIGEWSIVGAGAAVISDVPDRTIAAGVPARW